MSNSKEGYALITIGRYEEFAEGRWPNSINIGERYKLITFAKSDEKKMIELLGYIGYGVSYNSASEAISKMELQDSELIVVNSNDIHEVVDRFNKNKEVSHG